MMKKIAACAWRASRFMRLLALSLALIAIWGGCTSGVPAVPEEDVLEPPGEVYAKNADELLAFFEAGAERVTLGADIDMGKQMLCLTKARGPVALAGGGHTLTSGAASAIRLEDGCHLTLDDIVVEAEQIAIGMLGGGTISGDAASLLAGICVLHAAGDAAIGNDSGIDFISDAGMGIRANGIVFGEGCRVTVDAATCALDTDRAGIALLTGAQVSCTAYGDNAIHSEGMLSLGGETVLSVKNSGDHNAALVDGFMAEDSATLEAQGGGNGMGLFIVELNELVTLRGYSRPEARLELGGGGVAFTK